MCNTHFDVSHVSCVFFAFCPNFTIPSHCGQQGTLLTLPSSQTWQCIAERGVQKKLFDFCHTCSLSMLFDKQSESSVEHKFAKREQNLWRLHEFGSCKQNSNVQCGLFPMELKNVWSAVETFSFLAKVWPCSSIFTCPWLKHARGFWMQFTQFFSTLLFSVHFCLVGWIWINMDIWIFVVRPLVVEMWTVQSLPEPTWRFGQLLQSLEFICYIVCFVAVVVTQPANQSIG